MNSATWGAIFDWDGVVVDSSAHHEESWNRLAKEEGRTLPPGHFIKGFGMKNEAIIPRNLGWTEDPTEINRISLRKEAIYRTIILDWGISPLRGVKLLLDRLEGDGIPCVIGSSTHRLNITTSLEALGWTRYFRSLVTAEDVNLGKPDPQVFLLAAKAMEMRPERCVVFEDAPMGVEAGLAGGMKVVAVTSTHAKTALERAHLVIRRLDELDTHRIEGLFN